MNLKEIKEAINAGKKVYWAHCGYEVVKDSKLNRYLIICKSNDYTNGLTHKDNVTMNGKESDFFIGE